VRAVGVDAARRTRVASIGPVTSDAARALGLQVTVEARTATLDALADAVLEAFA